MNKTGSLRAPFLLSGGSGTHAKSLRKHGRAGLLPNQDRAKALDFNQVSMKVQHVKKETCPYLKKSTLSTLSRKLKIEHFYFLL